MDFRERSVAGGSGSRSPNIRTGHVKDAASTSLDAAEQDLGLSDPDVEEEIEETPSTSSWHCTPLRDLVLFEIFGGESSPQQRETMWRHYFPGSSENYESVKTRWRAIEGDRTVCDILRQIAQRKTKEALQRKAAALLENGITPKTPAADINAYNAVERQLELLETYAEELQAYAGEPVPGSGLIICPDIASIPPGVQESKILKCGIRGCTSSALFARKYELQRHMEANWKGEFPCTVLGCGRGNANPFKRAEHLRKHMRTIHQM